MNYPQYLVAARALSMSLQPKLPKSGYTSNKIIAHDTDIDYNMLQSMVRDMYMSVTDTVAVLDGARYYEMTPLGIENFEVMWRAVYLPAGCRKCNRCASNCVTEYLQNKMANV